MKRWSGHRRTRMSAAARRSTCWCCIIPAWRAARRRWRGSAIRRPKFRRITLIDEDGTVYAMVPEARRAWHAGISYWAGARDINARSIGIELVNPGHEFGYRAFAEAQIAALIVLVPGNTGASSHSALAGAGPQRCRARAQGRSGRIVSLGAAWREAGIGLWPAPGDDPGEAKRYPACWRAMVMTPRRRWRKSSRHSSAISARPASTAWQMPKPVRCFRGSARAL